MLNEMIVVAVTPFSGTVSADKNGKYPVMLQCLAGRMPNRNVLSGTVAERAGVVIGKTYLMNVRENGIDKLFGADFTFTKVRELQTGEDTIRTIKEIGNSEVLNIERPELFKEEYHRKTVAVEGLRTKRILSGDYEPVQKRDFTHSTADKVMKGSSYDSDNQNKTINTQIDQNTHIDIEGLEEESKRENKK